ncbi:anaphase-promoting complex subunit 7-like [Pomacea canaliculata]|uniref:anaphase-promoting complex subunit 7-like n=1 Tax=Pomacea canaliculata TaxID=400727 RepID=UPI000D725D33|nr:anaphase-promoting complex subunit 7-like [Pomacea canaliculata]
MNLFDHIRQLYQAELYEDFIHLFSLVLSLSENNEECELLTLAQKYQCFVYCGNACFQLGEYRKAVRAFKKSFLLKKAINKVKGKCGTTQDLTSEVDVKFRVYQCHMKLKETSEALQVLESISTKQRTAKINLALARLYQHDGRDRSALTCYKEVLREHPLGLVAVRELLTLGMRGPDVMSAIMATAPFFSNCEWLTGLIRCYASMATREHVMAISSLRSLETKPGLRDNIHLQDCLAEALFMAGQYTEAAMAFLRIRALDPFHMKNMDLYAYTLSREKRTKDLQILSQQLMEVNEQAVEPWVCMGYYSLNSINKQNERLVRTVYCAQKAYSINPQCTQALLLKGAALQELNRMQDALLHFHEAVSRAPDRFETYQGIIDCYIASHRLRDAVTLATRAFSHLGCTARTSTLLASVLAKSPTTVAKAKPYLEKALKMDPFYLEAVYIMCDILSQEQDYDRGIALVRQALQTQTDARLHVLLGDFLTHTNQYQDALDHYHIALSLDPSSIQAREGMERVEKHNEMGLEGSYDVEVEDVPGSDNEPDFDGSDMESTWSDTEFSQP